MKQLKYQHRRQNVTKYALENIAKSKTKGDKIQNIKLEKYKSGRR